MTDPRNPGYPHNNHDVACRVGVGVVRWVCLLGVAVLSAAVVASTSTAASAASVARAHWALDEIGSAVAVDSSGNGNSGTNYNVVGDGAGYAFNGVNSRVIVPDSDTLDPGPADFSFGATLVMTTAPAVGETYDVLRKGLTTTKGGEYKLEIVRSSQGIAKARCVVKDATKVSVGIQGASNLSDGKPHTVTCSRVGNSVVVRVDSLAPRTKTVAALGSVSNASKLALGAKAEATAKTGFDWYLGTILDARITVG